MARIDEQASKKLNAQIDLSRRIGRISPFTCFSLAATELADLGTVQQDRYNDQLRDYHKELCKYAGAEWMSYEQYQLDTKGKRKHPWYKYKDDPQPQFNYVKPAAGDYTSIVLIEGGIMAMMAVVLFMLSYVAFLRYDVR